MKTNSTPFEIRAASTAKIITLIFFFILFALVKLNAATKTASRTGNWSSSSTWSPSGVPASTDNVVVNSGYTVTVDGNYSCKNLDIGNTTASAAAMQITSSANSLTITGDLTLNAGNQNSTYTLNAGPGTINISGTNTYGGTTGTSAIQVSTGTINITPAMNLSATSYTITYTGAGTINFNGNFTDAQGTFTTYANCKAYFNGNYSVSSAAEDWGGKGTAYFGSTGTITATTNITFNNVEFLSSGHTTISNGAGAIAVKGTVTLDASSSLTCNDDITVKGNWTNNGGTFTSASNTVTFDSSAITIGGSGSTAFHNLVIGNANAVNCTMNNSNSCANLTLSANTTARTLTLGSGVTFTVSGNATINQPTANTITNALNVNTATCNIGGNLVFSGTNTTASRIAKIAVTSGTLEIDGTVTWMSNTTVATSVITVSTGTVTFGSSLTMGSGSGTLSVTGAATVNFNGTTAPSFNFGGAASSFTTASGSTFNFANGFTNTSNTLTLAAASQTNISGTITPSAAITFGNLQVPASATAAIASGSAVTIAGNATLASGSALTANQNFSVGGNWTNNGGSFDGGTYTVTFSGNSKTIGGTSSTDFNNITIGSGATAASCTVNTDITCANLSFDGNTVARTLTLGSGVNFTVSGNATINQPTSNNITNTLAVNTGNCAIYGNLVFSGTSNTTTRIGKITVTSGTFTIAGSVTWMSNTSSVTEVITVSTGTINFGSSLTMGSASGTISATGAATINFNGSSAPSLTFGGTTAPVLTTYSGSTINFAQGLSVTTTALTLASGSIITSGSAETPADISIANNTTVTNNGTLTVYGDLTGLGSNSAFVNGTNATVTLDGNAMTTGTLNASANGNTVIYNSASTQTVKTPTSSYSNIIFQNSGTVKLTGDITTKNITLSSGIFDDGGNTITISSAGNWTNNGGTFTPTGAIIFTGTAASQIGGTAATVFNNFTVSNSGGVTLNAPAAVNGALTLTNGVITTDVTNILQLTATATSSSGSASSYVNGPMIKIGNTDFTFPVGNGGRWRRVGVSGMTSATTQISAQYFYSSPPDVSNMSSLLTDVSDQEYWDVSRTVTSDPIKIRLYWETTPLASLTEDCAPLTVAHYKGGQWQSESSTMQSDPLSCLLNDSGSIETDWVSTFSPFSFGGKGGGSLPIKLVSFDAVAQGNIVQTNWITEIEINNDYFTVERSADASNWQEAARVNGAGNSATMLSYSQTDEHPLAGTSYYRLKQTDFDGHFTYSNIVPVTIKSDAQVSVAAYPNPTDNELFINVQNPSDEIKVEIFDMLGRKMFAKIFSAEEKSSAHTVSLEAKYLLPTGVYLLSVSTNGEEHSERVILN